MEKSLNHIILFNIAFNVVRIHIMMVQFYDYHDIL